LGAMRLRTQKHVERFPAGRVAGLRGRLQSCEWHATVSFMGAKGKASKTQRFDEFRTALMVNGLLQLLALFAAAVTIAPLVFILLIAALAYWLTVLWFRIRRPNALTEGNASMIRVGFAIWFLVWFLVMPACGAIIGALARW